MLIVDRYYRKIESVKDNIDNSLEITGILLKLKEHEATLRNYEDRFYNFQRMINTSNQMFNTNENNIFSNLEKIGGIKNDVSSNLENNIYK